jgi:hypothetical protein
MDDIKRTNDGRFAPGQSGNPDGRPKGSKNQITLLKESLEVALRERSEPKMLQVMDKALELALAGDRTMLRLLLQLHMSSGATQNEGKGIEKVSININGPKQEVEKVPTVVTSKEENKSLN